MKSPLATRRHAPRKRVDHVRVAIANQQSLVALPAARIRRAVSGVFAEAGRRRAEVSVALVNDATIAAVHDEFMSIPTPTDVLSFVLDDGPRGLVGQIVVSADTAAKQAPRYGWIVEHELLLYVVHGALHLVGYDDLTARKRAEMRSAEARHLAMLGIDAPRAEKPPGRRRTKKRSP